MCLTALLSLSCCWCTPQWQEQQDSCPGEEQLQGSLLLGSCCWGGWDRIHVPTVGLSSCLYQLGSWGSQLVLAAAPEVGLGLGDIHPKGWAGVVASAGSGVVTPAGAGVVTAAPQSTPGSFPVLSDLVLDSGINKQMMGEVVGTCQCLCRTKVFFQDFAGV